MVPFTHSPTGKVHRLLSASGNYHASEPSSILPAHLTGSKLDKLKKIWQRRPKFIALGGGGGTTTTATLPSCASPSSSIAKANYKKHSRRTTIGTGMIGFPQDFVHSKHVGIHDVREITYQPRHSIGALQMLVSTDLTSSLYRLTDSEAESQCEEEKSPVAPARRTSYREPCPIVPPHSLAGQAQSVSPSPRFNKVKRKSVPVHILQDLPEATAQPLISDHPSESTQNRFRFSHLSIEETVQQLINYAQPESFVDEKGRSLPVVGEEYLSQPFQAR